MRRPNEIRSLLAGLAFVQCLCIPSAVFGVDDIVAIERDCVISPHEVVDVSSALPGLLQQVTVARSDDVTAGQVLARLESGVERASLALARALASIDSEIDEERINQALGERRRDRMARLYQHRAAALDDKEQADTEAHLARVRVEQAQERRWIRELDVEKAQAALNRRVVRSPIDGVVVERFRAAGEYVENQPIVRIARLDPLRVDVLLPMDEFGAIHSGMQAEVRTEHMPELPLVATVSVVDRVGDAASGTFGVRLALPNPDARIPAGLRCRLRFQGQSHVAESAVEASQRELDLPATPVAANTRPLEDDAARLKQIDRCAAWGPFERFDRAQAVEHALEAHGVTVAVHQHRETHRRGFIVATSVLDSDRAAHALEQRLRARGVHDVVLLSNDAYSRRLSLGVYNGESSARRRAASIRAMGFDVEVLPRDSEQSRWWVEAASVGDDVIEWVRAQHAFTVQVTAGSCTSLPRPQSVAMVP